MSITICCNDFACKVNLALRVNNGVKFIPVHGTLAVHICRNKDGQEEFMECCKKEIMQNGPFSLLANEGTTCDNRTMLHAVA